MEQRTVFGGVVERAWEVFRITTQSSIYILAIHHVDGRRFAMARRAPGQGEAQDVMRDSDPRIDETSLWDLPPPSWVGGRLNIATMSTSAIRAVEQVDDPDSLRWVTEVGLVPITASAKPSTHSERPRPPYPEKQVEYAEDAAQLLRAVLRKEQLFDDAAAESSLLVDRLRVALTDCRLSLEKLLERANQ